jgi:hypothetical protein
MSQPMLETARQRRPTILLLMAAVPLVDLGLVYVLRECQRLLWLPWIEVDSSLP